jgi:hypothetical protein
MYSVTCISYTDICISRGVYLWMDVTCIDVNTLWKAMILLSLVIYTNGGNFHSFMHSFLQFSEFLELFYGNELVLFFLMVLGFELRALHLHLFYYLSHAPSPYLCYFYNQKNNLSVLV